MFILEFWESKKREGRGKWSFVAVNDNAWELMPLQNKMVTNGFKVRISLNIIKKEER